MQSQKTVTTISRKPILNKRVLLLQAVAILAMLLVAWLLWKRDQPERLRDLGAPWHYDLLSSGALYRFDSHDTMNRSGVVLLSRPVQGGKERTLVEEDSRYDLFSPSAFAVSDGSLFYALRPHQNPVTYSGNSSGASASTSKIRYLGAFAPSVNQILAPGNAPEKRVTRSHWYPPPTAAHFRQAPLQGGAARDLATIHCSTAKLIGSHVFWTRQSQQTQVVDVKRGNETWTEVPAAVRLVLTDLVNGSEQDLDRIAETYLTPGESGVFWVKLHPFPDDNRDLYYARATDGTVLPLGQMPTSQSIGWSVEYQKALYWFDVRKDLYGLNTAVLMAASLNGAGIGPVLSLTDQHVDDVPGENLAVYRGALYCLVRKGDPSIPLESRQILLARVHPDRQGSLDIVCRLPVYASDFHFDQGFLFYTLLDTEHSLLGTLAGDEPGGRYTHTLYRVPLLR